MRKLDLRASAAGTDTSPLWNTCIGWKIEAAILTNTDRKVYSQSESVHRNDSWRLLLYCLRTFPHPLQDIQDRMERRCEQLIIALCLILSVQILQLDFQVQLLLLVMGEPEGGTFERGDSGWSAGNYSGQKIVKIRTILLKLMVEIKLFEWIGCALWPKIIWVEQQ